MQRNPGLTVVHAAAEGRCAELKDRAREALRFERERFKGARVTADEQCAELEDRAKDAQVVLAKANQRADETEAALKKIGEPEGRGQLLGLKGLEGYDGGLG
eukprot:gene9849-11664_t